MLKVSKRIARSAMQTLHIMVQRNNKRHKRKIEFMGICSIWSRMLSGHFTFKIIWITWSMIYNLFIQNIKYFLSSCWHILIVEFTAPLNEIWVAIAIRALARSRKKKPFVLPPSRAKLSSHLVSLSPSVKEFCIKSCISHCTCQPRGLNMFVYLDAHNKT